MVISELDEVLYWYKIDHIVDKIKSLSREYYPNNPDKYYQEKTRFYLETIQSRTEFFNRLMNYEKNGKPIWVAGRNNSIDDISVENIQKSCDNITFENGKLRAEVMENAKKKWASHLDFYTDKILSESESCVLELTIGAGIGSSSVIQKMRSKDKYVGVDIDFSCAKNADGIGRYFKANAIGVCCNLWNLPFDDNTFSVICSHLGIDECREITTIILEAVRVLKPGGKIVLACRDSGYIRHKSIFALFDVAEDKAIECLYNTRLYANLSQLDEIAYQCHLVKTDFKQFDKNLYVVEYTK